MDTNVILRDLTRDDEAKAQGRAMIAEIQRGSRRMA